MSLTLDQTRPATPDDYAALAALYQSVAPDYPVQESELRYWEEHRDPKIDFARLVVLDGERLVAAGERGQLPWMFHPRKFNLEINVNPDYRRRGIGAHLYDQLSASLVPFDPLALRARTREDRADAVAFLEKRGFAEEERDWESRLNPQTARLEPLLPSLENVKAAGIELVSVAVLSQRDPDYRQKLYDLEMEAGEDVPLPEAFTPPDFESWQKREFGDPNLTLEAYLVAVDGERFVGMTQFWRSQTPGAGLHNGFTGLLREYRGRGVAQALKVKNLLWAREQGFEMVKTWNNTHNRAMLHINEGLGFEKQPAWITFVKVIKEEA